MVVPPISENIRFEEFMKELPADYHEMAYEFQAFTRSRKIKTPAQLLQVVMLYCGLDHVLRETAGVFTLQEERITDTAVHKRLKACAAWQNAARREKPFNAAPPVSRRRLIPARTGR